MNNLVEDVLDVLGFIIIMGVTLAISFSVVMPILSESSLSKHEIVSDKSAPKQEGHGNVTDYDGDLSKLEVVLMTQIQDFSLPNPKFFKVDTTKVEVKSFYQASRTLTGQAIYDELSETPPSGGEYRYDWAYNYGAEPSVENVSIGNLLVNGFAEDGLSSDGSASGWFTYTTTRNDVKFKVREGDSWVMNGIGTFEIETPGTSNPNWTGSEFIGYYYQNIDLEPSKKYRFSATLNCHRCEGYLAAEVFNDAGGSNEYTSSRVIDTGTPTKQVVEFTAPINAARVRVKLVKDVHNGSAYDYDYLFADDVSLQLLDGEDPHYYLRKK